MSMTYGQLSPTNNYKQPFTGAIHCPLMSGKIALAPTNHSAAEAPKYAVFQNINGMPMEVGAVWEKQIQRGDHAGQKMLSITIDGAHMEKPLNLSGFPEPNGDYKLVWSRPKRANQAESAEG